MPASRSLENDSVLEFPDAACRRLYERVAIEQWDIDRDIRWQSLEVGALGRTHRRAMANVYTQVRYGEVIAFNAAARIVAEAPNGWVRLFGEAQLTDEARHVEFFSRVVDRIGDEASVLPDLIELGAELSSSDSIDELLVGTQIVLEGFAQALFQEASRRSRGAAGRLRLPGSEAAANLVQYVTDFVGRDESRHVAFGVLALRSRWPELGRAERGRLEERALSWSKRISGTLECLANPLRALEVSISDVADRVHRAQRGHFRSIGLTVDSGEDSP